LEPDPCRQHRSGSRIQVYTMNRETQTMWNLLFILPSKEGCIIIREDDSAHFNLSKLHHAL
jgi:hypothetical protein